MLARIHVWLLCAALALFPALASAQSPIRAFPPGAFQNRAAIDANSSTVPFGFTFTAKANQNTPSGGTCDVGTVSIGAADATRKIIIAAGARFTTAAAISSITVGGSGATPIPSADATVVSNINSTLWSISLPTGTTANVTVTYSNTILRCEVAIYRLVGTTAAIGTGANNTSAAAGSTAISSLSIPSGGAAVATSISFPTATSGTATNLTQDVGELVGGSTTLFQAGNNTSSTGAITLTFSYNAGQVGGAMAAATFSP